MPDRIDLIDALYTTRSIRRFRPDPIPDDVLRAVIEGATRAPSGANAQRWRFLLVRDPSLRRGLGELYRAAFDEVYPQERLASETDPIRRRVYTSARYLVAHMGDEPPVLVLACLENDPAAPSSPPGPTDRTRGSSVYPAVQNLLLAARAHGLGGCLTTVHVRREAAVKALLGIPAHVDTYALVPLGYPRDRFGPLTRRPVEDVAFADRWGAPFAGANGVGA